MSRPFGIHVGAALALLILARPACADKLRITSRPSGASVELDGILVGTTPFEKDWPTSWRILAVEGELLPR
jgi:hypothetical protein